MKTNNKTKFHHHTPVLLNETVALLAPQAGESYLDLTAGYGGHAKAVLALTQAPKQAVLVDRDDNAIAVLKAELAPSGATLRHQDFASAAAELHRADQKFDLIMMDLGLSSPQVDEAERGFSFAKPAALDMRMDRRQPTTAADLVNSLSAEDLAGLLREFGEERHAWRIAKAIVQARPLNTTTELAEVVAAVSGRRGRVHPATQTFQALRIAVNRELEQLEATLALLPDLLEPGGRVAIISFHSLEDRLVKRWLKQQKQLGYEAQLRELTKKPIDGRTELVTNPRARSAKLRGAVKINT